MRQKLTKYLTNLLMLILAVIFISPQAAAISQNDADCANAGNLGGTCFYNPSDCATSAGASNTVQSGTGSLVWPFSTKSSSQYNRVDQGWDIQDKPGADIYAITSGTLHVYNPDPGGFGNDYPVEQLDQSIGGPTNWVYYGHVHILPGLDGKHVNSGDLIAHANNFDGQNGSGAPPGWLEIGFAKPGTDSPTNLPPIPTPDGQKMHDILINNNVQPANSSTASANSQPNNNNTSSADASINCSCNASFSIVAGQLPNYVKQPYNSIFTAAANKYNINPGLLVGIFYNEQYGYQNSVSSFKQHIWPTPPPPYGNGVPWNNNGGAGAQGPFQFLPSTWTTEGVSANGKGSADPNDLTDAAFGAAHYLSDGDLHGIKLTVSSDQTDITNAISYYYGPGAGIPNDYGRAAYTIYSLIKSDESSNSSSSSSTSNSAGVGSCAPSTNGSNCVGASGITKILCEAQQYKGIYYRLDGGHDYVSFSKQCNASVLSSAASNSTAANPGPCATDCSGLVSVAVDQAFSQNFSWDVAGIENDSKNWQKINIQNTVAGDVVTLGSDTHVEIVDHITSSGALVTFGSHAPGVQTGQLTTSTSYWTGAYRYIGPGS